VEDSNNYDDSNAEIFCLVCTSKKSRSSAIASTAGEGEPFKGITLCLVAAGFSLALFGGELDSSPYHCDRVPSGNGYLSCDRTRCRTDSRFTAAVCMPSETFTAAGRCGRLKIEHSTEPWPDCASNVTTSVPIPRVPTGGTHNEDIVVT
jgi:hypothetical protein